MKRWKSWTVKRGSRGELVSKEFYGDDVGELLTLFGRAPVLFVPLAKDFVEMGGGRLVVNNRGVFFVDFKRLGDQILYVVTDQHVWVELKGIDLFSKAYKGFVSMSEQEAYSSPERRHTGP